MALIDKSEVEVEILPPLMRSVLEKHSSLGGILSGEIPPNTHAVGYRCKIRVNPGVEPACLGHYQMTP